MPLYLFEKNIDPLYTADRRVVGRNAQEARAFASNRRLVEQAVARCS